MNIDYITERVMARLMRAQEKKKKKDAEERRSKIGLGSGDEAVAGHKELLKLGRGIVEEEPSKPDCRSGNKNFDKNGRFSTKDDAAVWSSGYEPRGEDCKYGKWSYKGGKTKKMTKHRCGRAPDGSKEEFRCKDGVKVNEEVPVSSSISKEKIKIIVLDTLKEMAAEFDGEVVEEDDDKRAKIKSSCNRVGHYSFQDFLLKLNRIERARTGDLLKDN
tara:strand:+ start:297 stop:947 length:651 start_codon:yes stop_codon:yes gene_type:complete